MTAPLWSQGCYDIESIIHRARTLLSYMPEDEVMDSLVQSLIPPDLAYFAVKAAMILLQTRQRHDSPEGYFR